VIGGRQRAIRCALVALLVVGCGTTSPSAAPPSAPSAATSPSSSGSASASSGPSSPSAQPAARHAFAHIYLLILENHEYGSIVGSGDAPYLNGLFTRYGLATAMRAVTHPSEPNYLALVSGGTQGVGDDGVYNIDAPSLFDQVEASGRTWHVFAQGYPGSCSAVASTGAVADGPGQPGDYARKHNPAISLTSISRNPARCAQITGLAGFDPGAADFEMIVPNQINDMHSASVRTGDDFLAAFLPSILGSAAFAAGSLLIVTFDEGGTNDGGGGHIATLVATPSMLPGTRFDGPATHYSVLRTIEEAWGMPALGAAGEASPLTPAP
jgi:hypothetical protein